jgi:hypothetical protein
MIRRKFARFKLDEKPALLHRPLETTAGSHPNYRDATTLPSQNVFYNSSYDDPAIVVSALDCLKVEF